jgi:hypothetical protein
MRLRWRNFAKTERDGEVLLKNNKHKSGNINKRRRRRRILFYYCYYYLKIKKLQSEVSWHVGKRH